MTKIFVVIDSLITDENSWEPHFASLLQGYVESSNLDYLVQEIRNKDLDTVKTYFQTGYIEPHDKFIFPNAWTSMTSYIKHWSENYNKPVEMIGLWSRGCYLNEDSEYRPMNDRNWRKVHERASFRCLDKSFFISEFHKEQFRILSSYGFQVDYIGSPLMPITDEFHGEDKNIKSKFGKNYNLVSTMIKNNGISKFSNDTMAGETTATTNPVSGLKLGLTDEEWTPKYQAILTKYNDDETDFS